MNLILKVETSLAKISATSASICTQVSAGNLQAPLHSTPRAHKHDHLKMLCAAPTLRTAAIGCRIQPTLLTPCTYHTTSAPPLRSTDSSSSTARRAPLPKRHLTFSRSVKPSASTIRSASTASEPPAPESTSTHDSTTDILDWNTFFKLRKQRRYWMLASSIGGGLNGFIGGAGLLARADMASIFPSIVPPTLPSPSY